MKYIKRREIMVLIAQRDISSGLNLPWNLTSLSAVETMPLGVVQQMYKYGFKMINNVESVNP
jgi:hypothetical protein